MKVYSSVGFFVLVAMIVACAITPGLSAQASDETNRDRLAPTLPARSPVLELLLAVPDTAPAVGSDLEVVRFGQAGRLSRPNALDIPERPQALELVAWDWLRPRGRAMELAARSSYRIWLEIHTGMQGVLVSSNHLELFWGTVEWKDTTIAATDRHLSAGDILIRGRGTAQITRDVAGVSVSVESGRFEVEKRGQLTTVVGSGQERLIPERESITARSAEPLRETHQDLLEILLNGERPDGATLSLLWERIVAVGPWYSYAEERRLPGIPHPDLILRDMGEVLRILAAFRFSPPPAMGM